MMAMMRRLNAAAKFALATYLLVYGVLSAIYLVQVYLGDVSRTKLMSPAVSLGLISAMIAAISFIVVFLWAGMKLD